MEFSHSYVTSLKLYKWDADCELFFTCLFRELSEATYYDQMRLLVKFKEAIFRWQVLESPHLL